MAPADVGLGGRIGVGLGLPFLELELIEAGSQHVPGGRPVLVLRALGLAGDDDAGGNVGDPHRRFSLVDVLSAGAGGAIGVDPAIALVNLDLDPVVDDRIQIDVNESDCRIDTYRASGAGGQHVNKTESAVRITHIPSGIVVACQSERSQHKNRATAWNMLRARLYERELEKREAATAADSASKTDIGWGHQIRSYVLQPYQMVKDLRTGHVSGTPSDVLDGDLDPFMEASLAQRLSGRTVVVEDVE